MKKILCIIPARSGSKGITDKNIKIMINKPLIAWTIEQAKKCKYANQMKIIVSTDSEIYKNIAIKYGAEVPFLRPSILSQDTSTDYEYINHAVDWLRDNENYHPDIILQLRPTQPCRSIDNIDKCINIFLKNYDNYDSLRTVIKSKKTPYKMYYITDDNLKPHFDEYKDYKEPYNIGRQELPNSYTHNGYIDILKTSLLSKKIISGDKIYPYIMNDKDNIDIDDIDDWNNCEDLLMSKIYKNSNYIFITIKIIDNFIVIENSSKIFIYFKRKKIRDVSIQIIDSNNNKLRCILDSEDDTCYLKTDNIAFFKNTESNKFTMQYFDDKTYDILKNYDIRKLLPLNLINYTFNKKIILCGNGNIGYVKNESNKFIDDHDIVVRINGFEIIPDITGTKTDIHYTGSTISTNGINPYEKNISLSKILLQNNSESFQHRFKKLYRSNKPIFKFDNNEMSLLHYKVFGTKSLMSGTQALLIFTLLKIHNNVKLNYIGFSNHELKDKTQTYYWGTRKLSSSRDIIRHERYHDFHLQYKMIDIINFF